MRAIFAVVGGCAVAAAAAVTVMAAPESPINVCALIPSMDSCQPPDVRGHLFVHKTNPPTITQISPTSGY